MEIEKVGVIGAGQMGAGISQDFVHKCNPEKVILYHGDNREAFSEDLKDYDLILPQENEIIDIN